MRVVRVQGCLPTVLLALAVLGVLAFAFTAGAVIFSGALALAAVGAAARWLSRGRRPPAGPRPPHPPPGAARDMVVEVEGGSRPDVPDESGEPPRLPPGS